MPDPILVSIAAAIAAKSATGLWEFVKGRFGARKEATDALEAAAGKAPDSPEVTVLAERLAEAEVADPAFGESLRSMYQQVGATEGGVVNQISGNVSGKVVQARDIEGGISF